MKLYYTPGVCSLAPHICLREAGADFEIEMVDLRSKKLASGGDYLAISKKGKVPALDIGEPEVLTENLAILAYIADKFPAANLAGTGTGRYRVLSWTTFVATELHKLFGPLFNPAYDDNAKKVSIDMIMANLGYVDEELGKRDYLAGDHFSIADAYLFVVLGWPQMIKLDISKFQNLAAFAGRVGARPAVQAALKAEGLA